MNVREAIVNVDTEAFESALAPDVVWVGVRPGWLCRNRAQVMETMRTGLADRVARPEILLETDELIVIDPHVEPPTDLVPGLHQVFVVHEGLCVEIRDYADRETALAAAAA